MADREAFGGIVAGHRELAHDPQPWPLDGCELLVLERQDAGGRVTETAQARLEAGDIVLGPPLGERVTGGRQLLDQLDQLSITATGRRRGAELGERLAGVDVPVADPYTQELIVDWDIHARQALAEFRAATATRRGDVELVELVEKLSASSDAFAEWWPEHDVAGFETRLRRFRHPAAGMLTFEYQQLAPVEWPGLRVVCQLPVPGDDSAERLAVRHYLV